MPAIKPDNQPLNQEEQAANKRSIDRFVLYALPEQPNETTTDKGHRKRNQKLLKIFMTSLANEKRLLYSQITLNSDVDNSPILQLFLGVIALEPKPSQDLAKELDSLTNDKKKYQQILRHLGTDDEIEAAILEKLITPLSEKDKKEQEKLKENSAADRLITQGYLPANYLFFSTDLAIALQEYMAEDKTTPAKVMVADVLLFKDLSNPKTEPEKADTALIHDVIEKEMLLAKQEERTRHLLIPINNGSGHFVFLQITINNNDTAKAILRDSMAEEKVSGTHRANNEMILKNVNQIINQVKSDGALENSDAIKYTGRQSDAAATCPFYAAREVVRTYESLRESKTDQPTSLALAAQQQDDDPLDDITDFQKAMIKKIALEKSPPEKKYEMQTLEIDDKGIAYTKDREGKPSDAYTQHKAHLKADEEKLAGSYYTNTGELVKGPYPGAAPTTPTSAPVTPLSSSLSPDPGPPMTPTPTSEVKNIPPTIPHTDTPKKSESETKEIHSDLSLNDLIKKYIEHKTNPWLGLTASDDVDTEETLSGDKIDTKTIELELLKIQSAIMSRIDEFKNIDTDLGITEETRSMLNQFVISTKDSVPELNHFAKRLKAEYEISAVTHQLEDIDTRLLSSLYDKLDELSYRLKINSEFRSQLPEFRALLDHDNLNKLKSDDYEAMVSYYKSLDENYRTIKLLSDDFRTNTLTPLSKNIETQISLLSTARAQLEMNAQNELISTEECEQLLFEIDDKISRLKSAQQQMLAFNKGFASIEPETSREIELRGEITNILFSFRRDESKATPSEPDEVNKILLTIIMTRKKMGKGKPTRKYLNQLYTNVDLQDFLSSSEAKVLLDRLSSLEYDLSKEHAKKILNDNKKAWGKFQAIPEAKDHRTDLKNYIYEQSSLIQQELAALNQFPKAQAKCVEYWITVLGEAAKNDPLTALIINNALSIDPHDRIEQDWINKLPIPKNVSEAFDLQKKFFSKEKLIAIEDELLAQMAKPEKKPSEPTITPNQELQNKKDKLRSDLSSAINEMYKYHFNFSKDMKELQNHFREIENVTIKTSTSKRAGEYATDLEGCATTIFPPTPTSPREAKASDVEDLDVLLTNLRQITYILGTDTFIKEFEASEIATVNFDWISKFHSDFLRKPLHQKYKNLNGHPNKPLVTDQFIKPIQKNPRTVILIKALIDQIDKLNKTYGDDPSKEIQDKIEDLKRCKIVLEKRQGFFDQKILELNAKLDQVKSNRKIAYAVRKHLPRWNKKAFDGMFNELKSYDNPANFTRVCEILIAMSKKTNTSKYITQACLTEAEILRKKIRSLDPTDSNYKLAKLNYEIAIHLLTSTKGLSVQTQEKVIELVKLLSNQPANPLKPQELIERLEILDQTKIEKLKKHRLYRRDQITKALNYLKENRDALLKNIGQEAKDNGATQAKILYLSALLEEWKAEGAAFKLTSEEIQHNNKRIELISDAISHMNEFKDKYPDLTEDIYKKLVIQLTGITDPAKETSLKTSEALTTLTDIDVQLRPRVATPRTISPFDSNFKFNEFSMAYIQQRKNDIKSTIETANTNYDAAPIPRKDYAKLLRDYLQCIRDEWKIKELSDPATATHPHVMQRNALIDEAITKLNDDTAPPDPDLPDVENIMTDFFQKLESQSSRPSDRSARLKHFVTQRFTSEKQLDALYAESQQSNNDIQAVFSPCKAINEGLKADKAYQAKLKEYEEKKAKSVPEQKFVHGIEIKSLGDRKVGTSTIIEEFNEAVKTTLPTLFIKRHLPTLAREMKEDPSALTPYKPSPQWTQTITGGKTADLKDNAAPSIAAQKPNYPGLSDGTYNEYTNSTWNTKIREERTANYVKICLLPKPADYYDNKVYNDAKRYQLDIANAEEAIRIWVHNCGNSQDETIDIADNPDRNTMEALIIVCKANDLKFRLPSKSRYNYDFVPDHKKLDQKASDLKDEIEWYEPDRFIKTKKIDKYILTKLESDIFELSKHYHIQHRDAQISDDEYKKYDTELTKINALVVDAKKGVYSATAINQAIERLEKNKAELKLEPPPLPTRRP